HSAYSLVSGGDVGPAGQAPPDALALMTQLAPVEGPGWTVDEFLTHWPTEPKPAVKTLGNAATKAVATGALRLVTKGKPGQPARDAKPNSLPPPAEGV